MGQSVYARCRSLFDYWTISDVHVHGRRFVIEQHGRKRDWADSIVYGTEYYVDDQLVTSAVFDRALRLAELAKEQP